MQEVEEFEYSLHSDTAKWLPAKNVEFELTDSFYWIRSFILDSNLNKFEHLGLLLGQAGDYEVYLNGQFVGVKKNTKFISFFLLNKNFIKNDSNEIRLKCYGFLGEFVSPYELAIGEYENLVKILILENLWGMIYGVIFLILAVYRYFSSEGYFSKRANNTFVLFLISLGVNNLLSTIPAIYNLDFSIYVFLLVSEILAVLAITVFVFHFYLEKYHYPNKKMVSLIYYFLVIFWLSFLIFTDFADIYFVLPFIFLFYLLFFAYKNKKKYVYYDSISISLLFGAVVLIPEGVHSDNIALLISILILNYSILLEIKEERAIAYELKLKSSKLQTDLLKKSIQPHFILNSLNAAIDWLEDNPKKGTELISNLADEFSMFSEMVEKKLVPIKDELKLCYLHISIMSFRTEQTYNLQEINLDNDDLVPPGVFHTLVENAIHHNSKINNSLNMVLEKKVKENDIIYLFSVLNSVSKTFTKEGTGYKYVRSRLSESYQQSFKLVYYHDASSWTTKITLMK